MTHIDPTEQMIAWRLVERAWDNRYPLMPPRQPDHEFIIDESMLSAMLHDPRLKLDLELAQMLAALEYWRIKMIEGVEEVAARYRAEVETAMRLSGAAATAAGL